MVWGRFLCVRLLIVTFNLWNVYTQLNLTHYEVLEVTNHALVSEIKSAYRKKALLLHPDKVSFTASDDEKLSGMLRFIQVNTAYEILSDPEKRIKYDLSLTGVQYDIVQDDNVDRYMRNDFKMYVRTTRIKVALTAKFKPLPSPVLSIDLNFPLNEVFEGVEKQHKFFRRKVCNLCKGTGAENGECRTCSLCEGTKIAKHIFSSSKRHFQQMTETSCAACDGKGCFIIKKCTACGGSGYTMAEGSLSLEVPKGFPNGWQINLPGRGHERKDGEVGELIVKCFYTIPDGWELDSESGDLRLSLGVSFDELLDGFDTTIMSPLGETIAVSVDKPADPATAIFGVVKTIVGKGMISRSGVGGFEAQRGNLHVQLEANWSGLDVHTLRSIIMATHGVDFEALWQRLSPIFAGSDNMSGSSMQDDVRVTRSTSEQPS